jgi:RimJ/RimL family protein N-acetyltransferase
MAADAFAVKPTLTGQRVVLRPFTAEDFPAIRDALRDPDTRRLTGSGELTWNPTTEQRVRRWYDTRNAQPDRLDLAVVDKERGVCIGEVVLNEWDPANRSCNFRAMVTPAGRDRGLGTEATRLLLAHGFERLHLHRISLQVFASNPRARRVYDKVGFVAEGVLREVLHCDGQWIDATMMSILASEWAKHRGNP